MPTMSRAESAVRTRLENVELELERALDVKGDAELKVAILQARKRELTGILESIQGEPKGGANGEESPE